MDDKIEWGAIDLEHFDNDSNKLTLINKAYVKYGDISLNAGHIVFNMDSSEVTATPILDSLGKISQKPIYKDKSDEFEAKKIRYNLKSKKAWVEYAAKKEGELTVHGTYGKYLSKDADTINQIDKMFIAGGIITTCDHENPHWGIKATKIKLMPNRLAVFGFSTLEIAGIPLYPLSLPFGMYPIFQGQKSGLILPRNIDYNKDYGIGFKDVGVYFLLNDYIDLKLTSDIYTRGSHALFTTVNYSKRYKYRGSFYLGYVNYFKEQAEVLKPVKSPAFTVRLTHNQDSKANPYQTIGGSLNLQFNNYQKTANNNAYSQLNNVISSNFNFSRTFPGSPFSITAAIKHDQNNSTHAFNVTLPDLNLKMNTIYPFKNNNRTGKEKWYEKINLNYGAQMQNKLNATDTTIFERKTWNDLKSGFKQNASTSAQFTIFKHVNLNFSVAYNENHFFKIIDKKLKDTIYQDSIGVDYLGNTIWETKNGELITDTISGWKVYRQIRPSVTLSTNKYGKILFNKGYIRGIKHKVTWKP
ncbi:MAG: putative LPS assembly protein LptD [Saprospiraceae bacterium]